MGELIVKSPGLLTSVQDAGRFGYQHLGIGVGGWLDDWAAGWANWLVDNPVSSPCLEITVLGPTLVVLDGGWAGLAGADLGAMVDGKHWKPGTSQLLREGEVVQFGRRTLGARAYLSLLGGLRLEKLLGSYSTDLRNGFGGVNGRALTSGDRLKFSWGIKVAKSTPCSSLLRGPAIRILPGVHLDQFVDGSLDDLTKDSYTVTQNADRMGIKLEGAHIERISNDRERLSEGTAMGSMQIPANGQPLLLGKDRGTIGGYPILAHVIRADWPKMAQFVPGDPVQFRLVDPEQAKEAYHEQAVALSHG